MMDENEFRKRSDQALTSLKQALITAEESADFEVEDQAGALHVSFDDGGGFAISPHPPGRQIWLSAPATHVHLDRSDQAFVFPQTNEKLQPRVARVNNYKLGNQ